MLFRSALAGDTDNRHVLFGGQDRKPKIAKIGVRKILQLRPDRIGVKRQRPDAAGLHDAVFPERLLKPVDNAVVNTVDKRLAILHAMDDHDRPTAIVLNFGNNFFHIIDRVCNVVVHDKHIAVVIRAQQRPDTGGKPLAGRVRKDR